MFTKKKETTNEKHVHEWMRPWSKEDYSRHNAELVKIGQEYLECEKQSHGYVNSKPRLFASDLYQIRNGGVTRQLDFKYDSVAQANGEPQKFDINHAKLDKYFKWVEFNRSTENRNEQEEIRKQRFNSIRQSIINFSKSKTI